MPAPEGLCAVRCPSGAHGCVQLLRWKQHTLAYLTKMCKSIANLFLYNRLEAPLTPIRRGLLPLDPRRRPAQLGVADQLAMLLPRMLAHKLQRLLPRAHPALKLRLLHLIQDFTVTGARHQAQRLQVVAGHQPGGTNTLGRRLLDKLPDKLIGIELSVSGQTIHAVQFQVFLEMRLAHETLQGGRPHLEDVLESQMLRDERGHPFGLRA